MTDCRALLTPTLFPTLEHTLIDLGFAKSGRSQWRRADLEVRVIIDFKAEDPFRGGAFTVEIERSDNSRFGEKLAGRVHVEQLLDPAQARLRPRAP